MIKLLSGLRYCPEYIVAAGYGPRLPIPAQSNLPIPSQKVLLEQRVHRFQGLSQVIRTPVLPPFGFVFKDPVIEPLAFDFSLNRKLLEACTKPQRSRRPSAMLQSFGDFSS